MGHEGESAAAAGKTVLLACMMMEDEVKEALRRHAPDMDVMWVERGFHDNPSRLNAELQYRIDLAESRGYDRILLAYGLCGDGVVGLKTRSAVLAVPRFDDCVNLMLCCGKRCSRGYAKAGIMYMTRGWTADPALRIDEVRRSYEVRFGERKAKRLMKLMWGSYRGISLIETGCYPVGEVMPRAETASEELGLPIRCDAGSIEVLEKLVGGEWDEDSILVVQPGVPISQSDFDWEPPSVQT